MLQFKEWYIRGSTIDLLLFIVVSRKFGVVNAYFLVSTLRYSVVGHSMKTIGLAAYMVQPR